MKTDIVIWAAARSHPRQAEAIDTAENWDEAIMLVEEYSLVYGPSYRVWSERQSYAEAEGGY